MTYMIDVETYNPDRHALDRGSHWYAQDAVLLMASWGRVDNEEEEIRQADYTDDRDAAAREEIKAIIMDPSITKIAHNAAFELAIFEHEYGITLDPSQWLDSAALAVRNGYPRSLDKLAPALGLPADERKDKDGKRLMEMFSWDTDGQRTLPADAPDEWERYKAYNRQDVISQIACYEALKKIDRTPAWEVDVWRLNCKINSRGVMIDETLAQAVLARKAVDDERLGGRFAEITGIKHTQVKAYREWLENETLELDDCQVPNVKEMTRKDLLLRDDLPANVRESLEIYDVIGGAANAKYAAMVNNMCRDKRVRDAFLYYGAGTGRWSSVVLQLQNFYRTSVGDVDLLRTLARNGDYQMIELLYGDCLPMFKQIARTALIAAPGCQFVDYDFSSIEARIAAWICGVAWKLDAFAAGEDVYIATAKQMFGLSECDKHTMTPDGRTTYRAMGKVAELAGGYGGGWKVYKAMDRTRSLTQSQLEDMCAKWQSTNRPICDYWYALDRAVRTCITRGITIKSKKGITLEYVDGALRITLPSGRPIVYRGARIERTDDGQSKTSIVYDGYKGGKQIPIRTYGAKIFENVVQGTARDCLARAMLKIDAAGWNIVMHIHDEIVAEVPEADAQKAAENIRHIMSETPEWAPGLPLSCDGWTGPYFKKD